MRPADRTRLTAALREHVARIAADLRARIQADGPERVRALRLHTDEQVGEDFEVWTDLLSRRAAVLWVLKSVYVRVLEDRGLLAPGRILDVEAQQLFEKLAPNLGETAFLRWVHRDLASPRGGLPELFAPQPAEVAVPSDELSRALLAFWRHRDPDLGTHWSFAEERFEGELMGDLYQELDPVVKDRFALCQTPDFVRAFILDRTLTPAIETFGADQVRLLDPACGSGHFLIDGLKRLVVATNKQHPDWDRKELLAHCLDRVVGMDLNDYACALARARLVMTAAELAGVGTLAEAARFHPHVYWADALEQVEKGTDSRGQQLGLFEPIPEEAPRASLTRPEVRATLSKVLEPKFHAVVANPPYITENDEARKAYHREKVGKIQRYVSAYRQYSLASPFTERCFQIAVKEGFIGLITSNNFMKREFGKPLIEQLLANLDLTLIADTSQAYIPFHGTPTVLLFGRNRRSPNKTVRAVMGKRGEPAIPQDAAKGQVWTSILRGSAEAAFENEFVSVADVLWQTLSKHPWSLGGGGIQQLREKIDSSAGRRLHELGVDIGRTMHTGLDEAFYVPQHVSRRFRSGILPLVRGEDVRDWTIQSQEHVICTYNVSSPEIECLPERDLHPAIKRWLWRNKAALAARTDFGKTLQERNLKWYEWSMFFRYRLNAMPGISFPVVATHGHFAIAHELMVFNSKAPAIKLPDDQDKEEYFLIIGLLNSSTACFWMKQVFHNKGGGTNTGKWQSDPAKVAFEFAATGLLDFPIPKMQDVSRTAIVEIAKRIDLLAQERAALLSRALPEPDSEKFNSASAIRAQLQQAETKENELLCKQIALQEELDWRVYALYGLVSEVAELDVSSLASSSGIGLGARPFEIVQARSGRAVGVDGQPLHASLPSDIDHHIMSTWTSRIGAIESNPNIALLENENYKRRWLITPKHLAGRVETFADRARGRTQGLLEDLTEHAVKARGKPADIVRIATDLQDNSMFRALAELLTGKRDYSHEGFVRDILENNAAPQHPFHRYTDAGLLKRSAWEQTWEDQRREDAGEKVAPRVPPSYIQADFLTRRVFELRGKLDVPKERFIAFTEVPGRNGDVLYGWAGWTPLQRLKALLAIDEDLEDSGVPLADRAGVLDSAWRLLPDVAREDAAAASRLKAELQALVGPDGPSREMMQDWRARFPPPGTKAARKPRWDPLESTCRHASLSIL